MCATGEVIRDQAHGLKVIVAPNDRGDVDVLLRLDGSYRPDGGAVEAAERLREALIGGLQADGVSELEVAASDLLMR